MKVAKLFSAKRCGWISLKIIYVSECHFLPLTFIFVLPSQLCQVVRLVPGAYLEYKQALLNECRRQGGLRLAQARALIKIDVNKTRKIYDFLIKEGYITKA